MLFNQTENCLDYCALCFSLRYLQNEPDLPSTPPESKLYIPSPYVSKQPSTPRIDELKKYSRSTSLTELNGNIFKIGIKEPCKLRLPSLENRPLQKRKIFNNTTSLDNRKKIFSLKLVS